MIRQSWVGDLTVLEWCSISALPLLSLSCRCFTSTLPVLRRCLIIKSIGWANLILFWSANATAVLYQSSGYAALALESCGFGNSQEIRRFSINTVLFHCICFARASPVHFRYSVDIVPILCSTAFLPRAQQLLGRSYAKDSPVFWWWCKAVNQELPRWFNVAPSLHQCASNGYLTGDPKIVLPILYRIFAGAAPLLSR